LEGPVNKKVIGTHDGWINSIALSPDNFFIVTGSNDKTVRYWHLNTSTKDRIIGVHTLGVLSVCISSDNTKVVSAGRDKVIRLWNL
jgi:WD40 repeat protein